MPQSVTFDIPVPARVSRHRDRVREANMRWVVTHGLAPSAEGREAYRSWDLADAAARIYHAAECDALVDTLNFFSIGFLFDDQFDPTEPDRLDAVARAAAEMAAIPFRPLGAPTEFTTPITVAWAGLWPRMAAATSPVWQARFAGHFAQWLTAHVWETRLTAERRVPDPDEYVRLRRRSVGLDHSYDVAEWTYGFELPVTVAAHPLLRRLRLAATDAIAFMNDIHSYEREMSRREAHNLVSVLRRHEGLSSRAAVAKASGMAREALDRFLRLRGDVPAVCDALPLSHAEAAAAFRFVEGIGDWIRGNHDWAVRSGRYRVSEAAPEVFADDLLVAGARR
ncbi:terpene cyclase [Streptomyces sp. NPDC007808]|uniref:terpene synthase family protein n=1 Tax=Streptomyces sp. NPDC007808 TaxID=3364779 RepID=UPI0036B1197A